MAVDLFQAHLECTQLHDGYRSRCYVATEWEGLPIYQHFHWFYGPHGGAGGCL
ncbi:hypothetical protein E3U43_010894 [Larimichthys crocea]|uniref:Uncharacterized protein n=1 Tax=Larimichthys crocea TaxID=215358 RepID=A0ACD3RGI5_LARCR|nr:hypothetical protein E3U43_010894 [Larimichthys crocea]